MSELKQYGLRLNEKDMIIADELSKGMFFKGRKNINAYTRKAVEELNERVLKERDNE